MTGSKNNAVVLRSLSIGASLLVGSVLAFFLGARVGGNLDHRTRSVTIAHAPQPTPASDRSSRTAVHVASK